MKTGAEHPSETPRAFVSVEAVLSRIVDSLGPIEERDSVRVASAWKSIASEGVLQRADVAAFSGGELVVGVSSHVWLYDLAARSEELRSELNSALGEDIVTEIRFVFSGGEKTARSNETHKE